MRIGQNASSSSYLMMSLRRPKLAEQAFKCGFTSLLYCGALSASLISRRHRIFSDDIKLILGLSGTMQGVPKNRAPFVLMLWGSAQLHRSGFNLEFETLYESI